ncbi:MAG: molybdopterin-synthase adenylyltransferase MoeB [Alphaproteobacteria bacterium]|nr:molybdopterin-synthase adenylyltransferase MoeB [Alphaproteobacteria bacterium]
MAFVPTDLERYARHLILGEVGGAGQAKLLQSRVLVVGAGGLGAPLLLYLAAAGVGTLGIVDDDAVSLSNLQRQVIHTEARIGAPKTESAQAAIATLNRGIKVELHTTRLNASNALDLIARYDLVADGTDNFETRFLLNDACYFAKRPLVSGSILRFDGQLATYKAHLGGDNPCYRCIFREPPPPGLIPSCAEGGVLGAIAGTVGSLQATEVLKELMGIGESLSGQLLIYEALSATFRKVRVKPDPACPLCGTSPTIKDLSTAARDAESRIVCETA